MKEPVEQLVSLKVAKMAKDRGFNVKTSSVWLEDEQQEHHYSTIPLDWNKHEGLVSLPTLSQLHRWLREVQFIHVRVWPEYYKNGFNWNMQVTWWLGDIEGGDEMDDYPFYNGTFSYGDNGQFKSYEHALENGLIIGMKMMEYDRLIGESLSNEEWMEIHKNMIGYFKDEE